MKIFQLWRARTANERRRPQTEYYSWSDVVLPALQPPPAVVTMADLALADTKDWFTTAVGEVVRLSKLPANWDTYGSPPISDYAKCQAVNLISRFGSASLPTPIVGAVSGGGIQFEWTLGPRALELEVLPDGSVQYLRAYEDDRMAEGRIPPDSVDRLREQVRWLVQHPA